MTPSDRQEVQDLKAHVDLAELVRSSGLELKRKGKNWLGRCPFHDDQTASLSISGPLWNCFACEAGGDVFSWLQLKEKLSFADALARLRELAGESLVASTEAAGEHKKTPPLRSPELMARVCDLYQGTLLSNDAAQQYLQGRSLGPEVWKAFRVGFCDGTLLKKLPQDGLVVAALQELGLLTADGKEHFRGCVVVPLTHPDRGVVGFYGRRIRPDAKVPHLYLPGPRQGVLNWQSLKTSPSVTVAESVLDALSLWQAGLREVTCVYGAQGLTDDLKELVQQFEVRELTLCLDGDAAGQAASQRLADSFRDLKVSVAKMPDGKDPNQVLQESGPQVLWDLARRSQPIFSKPQAIDEKKDTGTGFLLDMDGVTYNVQPMPPFTSRLRVGIRAHKGDKWLQDRFDLYVHRDRVKLASQIAGQLGVPRIDAERHQEALFRECDGWAAAQKIKAEAAAKPKAPPALSEAERLEALQWLRQPDLKDQILKDIELLGYVGEEQAKLLVYLIGISRKLPKPLSGIIISQAGVGKSSLTEIVEQLTPPEDVLLFTRITSQALIYMTDNLLKGKVIIVEERVVAEAAEYSIRVLQSRNKLTQATPIKDPITGLFTTKIFTVEGPVAYLETTTDARINHENATRCFEINLDESERQTARIQAFQRAQRLPKRQNRHLLADQVAERHHQAQRLLQDVLVFIPYAELLTFPSKKLRTRRDNERFLCLIEAVAFLHQFQRERGETEDGTPYILANLEDYRLAYELAKDVLSATLHELSRAGRDVWLAVRDWVVAQTGDDYAQMVFTRRDVRLAIGVEDHQLRAALQELTDMEYLELVSGSNGKTYYYKLLVAREEDAPVVLVTPDDLARRWPKK